MRSAPSSRPICRPSTASSVSALPPTSSWSTRFPATSSVPAASVCAGQAAPGRHQDRARTLAAGPDDVAGNLGDQGEVGGKALRGGGVQGLEYGLGDRPEGNEEP